METKNWIKAYFDRFIIVTFESLFFKRAHCCYWDLNFTELTWAMWGGLLWDYRHLSAIRCFCNAVIFGCTWRLWATFKSTGINSADVPANLLCRYADQLHHYSRVKWVTLIILFEGNVLLGTFGPWHSCGCYFTCSTQPNTYCRLSTAVIFMVQPDGTGRPSRTVDADSPRPCSGTTHGTR